MTTAPNVSIEDLGLDLDRLRAAIREEYSLVASAPDHGFHFQIGRPVAKMLDYEDEWLEGLPESAIESFAGTGNPFSLGRIQPGERVVDIGCGAGTDSLIAAHMVGPEGEVIGVDMTPAMLEKARRAKQEIGLDQVEFRQGFGEELPVGDDWADVVISNGVLNLMPDKSAGLKEMSRVLKPGGRLQIGDILVEKAVPESAKRNIDLWTGWIAGALLEAELEVTVVTAGFVDFELIARQDMFSGTALESGAADFGAVGITFRARKPVNDAEWLAQLAALNSEAPGSNTPEPARETSPGIFGADAFYDAGDQGCAYGPLDEIARQMRNMASGQTMEIRATDPSVSADLQAWCRMVGHQFVAREGNHYLIRRQ